MEFEFPLFPPHCVSSSPAKPDPRQACPARALLLAGWELSAPRSPRKELGPLLRPWFASRQLRQASDQFLGNNPEDPVTWAKVYSLAVKEQTRSNRLGQSKMGHFCKINECSEAMGTRATCNTKIAGMAV